MSKFQQCLVLAVTSTRLKVIAIRKVNFNKSPASLKRDLLRGQRYDS